MSASSEDSFPTTQWTLVEVINGDDHDTSAKALEELCERYWYPVYVYLCRSGFSSHDAEDLTQGVFEKMVLENALANVLQERGRLRSYIIGMIRRLISRQQRHDHAVKRGGRGTVLSLDLMAASERYAAEPACRSLDPEQLYQRAWAFQLLEAVRSRLRQAFKENRRLDYYLALEPYLGLDDSPAPFAKLAAQLSSTESSARVAVHRLRDKFRNLLEVEISKTVLTPQDVAEELAWLRQVVSGQ